MNTAIIRSDWVGRVIDGRFALRQWLGGSEQSGVFLTELEGGQSQKAVLKLIPAEARSADAQLACWARTETLSHPHLMRLFCSGRCWIEGAALLYAVTEYSDEILSDILQARSLTPAETREMLAPVLDALTYLHGKGFVHGHLKPLNILVVGDQLKLSSDRFYLPDLPSEASGVYDAPEAATENLFSAADLWSLGITLVEVLTQHAPVWNPSAQLEPVVPESIPQPFAAIARECLRVDPERRCTVKDVKDSLDPARPVPPRPRPAVNIIRAAAPVKLGRMALVAAVLVLLVIGVLFLHSHRSAFAPSAGEPQAASRGASAKAAVVQQVLPDVLPAARASIHGQFIVTVRVTVDLDGQVSNAAFDSPGPSKYFARVSLEAAQKWRFQPARVDGHPIPSVWLLQFQFTQAGTEVTPVLDVR
jgi:serine/threonine-protein kinase